jgi:hypothetical protein
LYRERVAAVLGVCEGVECFCETLKVEPANLLGIEPAVSRRGIQLDDFGATTLPPIRRRQRVLTGTWKDSGRGWLTTKSPSYRGHREVKGRLAPIQEDERGASTSNSTSWGSLVRAQYRPPSESPAERSSKPPTLLVSNQGSLYAIPTWTRTAALIAEHAALRDVCGGAPSHWALYRFTTKLRAQRPLLDACLGRVLLSSMK